MHLYLTWTHHGWQRWSPDTRPTRTMLHQYFFCEQENNCVSVAIAYPRQTFTESVLLPEKKWSVWLRGQDCACEITAASPKRLSCVSTVSVESGITRRGFGGHGVRVKTLNGSSAFKHSRKSGSCSGRKTLVYFCETGPLEQTLCSV